MSRTTITAALLTLAFAFAGYAQEVDREILLSYQAPMLLQSSDQTQLLGTTDVESRELRHRKPPPSVGRIAGEIAVGEVGGWVGIIPVFWVIQLFDDPERDDVFKYPYLALPTILLTMVAGPSLGSSCGVYLVGNIGNETGSFLRTLGVSAGVAAIGVLSIFGGAEPGFLLLALGPPIGATIGFNRTRRYDSPPAESETALINVRDGQMSFAIPRVYFRPDSFGRGNLSQSVDLVQIRF